MFESLISAGTVKPLSGWDGSFSETISVVLRHGRTRKEMCRKELQWQTEVEQSLW